MPRLYKMLVYVSLVSFLLFSLFFFGYHFAYYRKIIPGVKVGNISVGGLTVAQAEYLLDQDFPEQTDILVFKNSSEPDIYSYDDFGVTYQASVSAALAARVARSGNLLKDLGAEWRAWKFGMEIDPFYVLDDVLYLQRISEISSHHSDGARDASFYWDGGLKIASSSSGVVVNEKQLNKMVMDRIHLQQTGPLTIPCEERVPQVSESDLGDIKEDVLAKLSNPPVLSYQQRQWKPSKEQMLSFLSPVSSSNSIDLEINEKGLNTYVASIAKDVDRPSRGGTFELADGRVVEFSLAQDGLKVDQSELSEDLAEAILGGKKSVTVPVSVTPAPRLDNNYGVRDLLGIGDSDFSGSGAGRVHNIAVASGRLSGILVPPGEEFSFNQSLGDVSADTGYQSAWIIKNGRTILGTGGGVCQVSTTLFRAALNAGLPILKRSAHAYRVHYYEPPVGFDATVYSPAPDLVFKNDTPAYILIDSSMNRATNSLRFSIYGTDDGRNVNITGPKVYNETSPPEPLYQEDDSLPEGTVKQVDWAAWGADVTFWRAVTRGGETLQEDVFHSHYQPWQAVYLVGTGE
jgi:vancomycin resistance protein YoaR